MAVKPITPDEVASQKKDVFPEAVFEAFNECIIAHFKNGVAVVAQRDVVALMKAKGLKGNDIYDKGWLDVESAYEEAGWKVEYDKPGYNESYEPTFTFTKKRKK